MRCAAATSLSRTTLRSPDVHAWGCALSRPAIRQLRLRELVAGAAVVIFVMMALWLRRLLTLTLVAEVAELRRASAFDRPRGLVDVDAAEFLVMPLLRRICFLAPRARGRGRGRGTGGVPRQDESTGDESVEEEEEFSSS